MANAYNMRLLAIQKKAYEQGLAALTDGERELLVTQRIAVPVVLTEHQENAKALESGQWGVWA